MKEHFCPACGKALKEAWVTRPAKVTFRWYDFTTTKSFCGHCNTELAITPTPLRARLLALPFMVIAVLHMALLESGGVNGYLFWGSAAIALIGATIPLFTARVISVPPNECKTFN